MGRQATAWRYNDKGRGGGKPSQNKTKEKEYKFATQEQMSRGYYGTYNSVKDNIITEVQKAFEYGCNIATAIRSGTKFDLLALEPERMISTKDKESD